MDKTTGALEAVSGENHLILGRKALDCYINLSEEAPHPEQVSDRQNARYLQRAQESPQFRATAQLKEIPSL
jgi:hypothetical protein